MMMLIASFLLCLSTIIGAADNDNDNIADHDHNQNQLSTIWSQLTEFFDDTLLSIDERIILIDFIVNQTLEPITGSNFLPNQDWDSYNYQGLFLINAINAKPIEQHIQEWSQKVAEMVKIDPSYNFMAESQFFEKLTQFWAEIARLAVDEDLEKLRKIHIANETVLQASQQDLQNGEEMEENSGDESEIERNPRQMGQSRQDAESEILPENSWQVGGQSWKELESSIDIQGCISLKMFLEMYAFGLEMREQLLVAQPPKYKKQIEKLVCGKVKKVKEDTENARKIFANLMEQVGRFLLPCIRRKSVSPLEEIIDREQTCHAWIAWLGEHSASSIDKKACRKLFRRKQSALLAKIW